MLDYVVLFSEMCRLNLFDTVKLDYPLTISRLLKTENITGVIMSWLLNKIVVAK